MQRRQMLLGGVAAATWGTATHANGAFFTGHPDHITDWKAIHFSPSEFASKGNGMLHISKAMVANLDRVRAAVRHPIRITSGYRDPAHNRRVGGAKFSRHVVGDAVDINLAGLSAQQRHVLMWHLLENGFTSFGSYTRSPNMLHADMRPNARRWHHGSGAHPAWFTRALTDWGWQRDVGITLTPSHPS